MKPCLLLPLILALAPPVGAGPALDQGREALDNGLWEVARFRFVEAIADPGLEADLRTAATLGLAQALIRGGTPAAAIPLLEKPPASLHPDASFWKSMALTGMGRFTDAIALLSPFARSTDHPYRREAAFTSAHLHLALGHPADALATLASFAASAPPADASDARLRQAAIHLDLGQPADARALIAESSPIPASLTPFAAFLDASALLAEKKPEAAAAFAAILAQPESQPLIRHHSAALGLADARALRSDTSSASEGLLDFVQKHPDTPLLSSIFERLTRWLPEDATPTHPTLKRLKDWIPDSPLPVTSLIAAPLAGAVSALPRTLPQDELPAFAMFTRAIGLHRTADPATRAEAQFLLTRIRLEHPAHPLATKALIQSAHWHLASNRPDLAFTILGSIRNSSSPQHLRAQAAFIEARANYENGDHPAAATLFNEAADLLAGDAAASASFNSTLALIQAADPSQPVDTSAINDPALAADLALEQALATRGPTASLAAIESFLTEHPNHPRVPEARLAAAEAALASSPPDPSLAKAQLDTLQSLPNPNNLQPARIHLARLRIADLDDDPATAIETARTFIQAFPDDPATPEATLTLGRKLFESGDYNDSRLVLEKLAASDTNPVRTQAALLIAARSAALIATTSSKTESLSLFDRAIAIDGPLTIIATHEKARVLIDLKQLDEATRFLRTHLDPLPPDSPLRIPTGLLLAEALYAQGGKKPDALAAALATYDQLLPLVKTQPALLHRLQYNRGMILERLPHPDHPNLTREAEAFDTYHSVLINASNPPAEWLYFENCGRRALDLLENAKRWQAAIKLAEKIASFQGPSAAATAERAKQIRLKHMIWED